MANAVPAAIQTTNKIDCDPVNSIYPAAVKIESKQTIKNIRYPIFFFIRQAINAR